MLGIQQQYRVGVLKKLVKLQYERFEQQYLASVGIILRNLRMRFSRDATARFGQNIFWSNSFKKIDRLALKEISSYYLG